MNRTFFPRITTLALAGLLLAGAVVQSGCSRAEKAAEDVVLMTAEEEGAALRRPDPAGTYGNSLVRNEPVAIEALVANAADYQNETVQIRGVVDEVCPMRGCWMDIADGAGNKMRIKVTDGQIVFPLSAKGHEASVEGTLMKIEYDAEQALAYRAHMAEELGQEFDPATAEQGPMVIWQLDGKGAVISD